MRKFTPTEYVQICMANHFGLDKENWQPRLDWTKQFLRSTKKQQQDLYDQADEPILLKKAFRAYQDAVKKKPSGFLGSMDATASGLQILACITGCKVTAANVNLIDTGNREDIYSKMSNTMTSKIAQAISRSEIKHPVMTTFYGSKKMPIKLFGKGTKELEAFYYTLETELPGAYEAIEDIQSCWQGSNLVHSFTLPDNHTAYIPVTEMVKKKIEIDELEHTTFTYQTKLNMTASKGISLLANIVHAIDGYVVREMIRRAYYQGFELLTIHDSFWAHPNFLNNVRRNYMEILSEIAGGNLLQDILRQVTGDEGLIYAKEENDLAELILQAEYPLS